MILNVSGRTDIVAFYTPWFIKRYKEGFLDVRNPFYEKQVSRIYFKDVDAIVFCTKNPIPILPYLKDIDKPILFHVTLTPYKKDIEPNVPPKGKIIEAIKLMSKIIGKENIYVRYDPVLLNDNYTINYHIKAFDNMCNLLDGYINHVIISFVDDYKNVRNHLKELKLKEFTDNDYEIIGKSFSESASKHNITVQTCFEENNLIEYGFIKGECLNATMAYKLTGKTNFKLWKARKGNMCKCVEMVDIGIYNSCCHFCKYCYANFDEKKVKENMKLHDINSSLLIGNLKDDDIIKVRK
jgi:hypothetical protein